MPPPRFIALLLLLLLIIVGCGCSEPSSTVDGGPDADQTHTDGDLDSTDGDLDSTDGDLDSTDGDLDSAADAEVDQELEPCLEGWVETFGEATELRLGAGFVGELPECASAAHFAVMAAGMTARLELQGLPAGTSAVVTGADGASLDSAYVVGGAADLEISPSRSGEVRLELRRPDGHDRGRYSGRLACTAGCDLEATRYPIVLVHGLAGTDSYFGLFDYFYDVLSALTARGYAVYTPVTELIAHSEERAPLLAAEVDEILAQTGARRLHFIGHSQGGLDLRILLTGLGYEDRAATVTTIATPHHGLRIELPDWLVGMDFSEGYLEGEFASLYPSPETIPVFSWSGRTCAALELSCQEELDGELVSAMLATSYRLVQGVHADDAYGGANDGLVPVASAIWGEHLGVLPADHLDEIGQVAGGTQGPFDHLEFFLDEARRLRDVEIVEGL